MGQGHQDESSRPIRPPVFALTVIRALDLLIALCATLLLAPLILVIAVAIQVVDGSPVIFRQRRSGLGQQPFEILKFRTLAETDDEKHETRLGSFLRRTNLDELPQLLNIIRGQMSFVGPRPLLPEYDIHYRPRERLRFQVRPGLTGLAQIVGRNEMTWDDKLETDVVFVESYSVRRYMSILLRTPFYSLTGRATARPWDYEKRLDDERS